MKKTIIAAALAFAATFNVHVHAAERLNVCSGQEGGFYIKLGRSVTNMINAEAERRKAPIKARLDEDSLGSLDNAERMKSGECHIAIMQGDVSAYEHKTGGLPISSIPFPAHTEAIHYLANARNGINDLDDIEDEKDMKVVVVDGSGALAFLRNVATEDEDFARVYQNAIRVDDMEEAAMIASAGTYNGSKIAGAVVVTRIGSLSQDIVKYYGKDLLLGSLSDSDFLSAKDGNGELLYRECEIPSGTYALKQDSWGDQETICMSAVIEFDAQVLNDLSPKDRKLAKKVVRSAIARTASVYK